MIAVTGIEEVLFEIANALRIPVFTAAIAALVFVVFDLGAFFVELARRGRRGRGEQVAAAAESAREALAASDAHAAERALMPLASSAHMADTLSTLVAQHGHPGAGDRRAAGRAG